MRGIAALFALWAGLFGAGSTVRAEELAKLTIGTVLPETGPQAAFGKEAAKGLGLALDVLKLRDPALAARIIIVRGDDQSTAKEAGAVAQRLIEKDRVNVLIGSIASVSTSAVATEARKKLIPLVTPISTQSGVTLGGGVYRSCFDEGLEGAILAEFALKTLGIKEAATLRENAVGTQIFVERFAAAFKAGGGEIKAQETYDLAAEDFTAPLKKIAESGAKLIITPAPYHTAGAMMAQAKKAAPGLKFLGGDTWDTKELIKAAGPAAAGHYFATHFALDDQDPLVAEFAKVFQQKYGRAPGAIAALTYDATLLVVDAFARARTNLKGPLSSAIGKTKDFQGVTGLISFTETGEFLKGGIIKETLADGSKFKVRVMPLAKPVIDPKHQAKGH